MKALPGNSTQAFPHVCPSPITVPVWSAKQEISTNGDCYQRPLKIKGLNPLKILKKKSDNVLKKCTPLRRGVHFFLTFVNKNGFFSFS